MQSCYPAISLQSSSFYCGPFIYSTQVHVYPSVCLWQSNAAVTPQVIEMLTVRHCGIISIYLLSRKGEGACGSILRKSPATLSVNFYAHHLLLREEMSLFSLLALKCLVRAQELCESRGESESSEPPFAHSSYGLCGREATLNRTEQN